MRHVPVVCLALTPTSAAIAHAQGRYHADEQCREDSH
jgi:hypothetical protein